MGCECDDANIVERVSGKLPPNLFTRGPTIDRVADMQIHTPTRKSNGTRVLSFIEK